MVDTIEGQWDGTVLGSDEQLITQGEYTIEVDGYATLAVQNISYSPSISSVKKARVSALVPPSDFNSVIGATCRVLVGSDKIIEGEIKKLNANKDNNEVELVVHPIGLEIKSESVDIFADDFILQDFMAKVIDEFNQIDGFDTDIYATSTTTYTDVGPDASQLELVYVKGIFDGGMDVTIDDGTNTYTETFNFSTSQVGRWVKVDPGTTFDSSTASYDITFDPGAGSKLAIFRAMRSLEMERTINPMTVNTFTTGQTVALANDNESWNDFMNKDLVDWDKRPHVIENGKLKQQKIRHWVLTSDPNDPDTPSSDDSGFRSTGFNTNPYVDTAVKDNAMYLNKKDQWVEFSWTNEYNWPRFAVNMRYYMYEGDLNEDPDPFDEYRFNVILDGEIVRADIKFEELDPTSSIDSITGGSEAFEWGQVLRRSGLEKGEHTLRISVSQDNGYTDDDRDSGIVIDCIVARDYVYSGTFDNTLDANNLLSSPGEYWESETLEAEPISAGYDVSELTLDGTYNHTEGFQYIQTRNPGDRQADNTATATFQYNDIEEVDSDILIGLRLASGDLSSPSRPPTSDNKGMEVDSFQVTAKGSNIPLVNGTNVRGNRLSVLTDESGDSEIFFRVDGNEFVIMQRGALKTTPDLRKESVESSIDIEDSYDKCQVIGRRAGPDSGMRFGTQEVKGDLIVADNSPTIVDDTKIIEDKSKTTERACNEAAVAFLTENARIKYDGRIETLPTFAPLGENIDGSLFSHGNDMMIESVDYGMDQTTITFGREHDFSKQIVEMVKNTGKNSRGI